MDSGQMQIEGNERVSSLNHKMDCSAQENLIDEAFSEFLKDPNDEANILSLRKERQNLEQEILEDKVNHMAYRIVEETSRNMVMATKKFKENLEDVEKFASQFSFDDIITVELKKKWTKLESLIKFLELTKTLNMLSSKSKAKLLECKEILASALEIRKIQREFITKNTTNKAFAQEFMSQGFLAFLQEFKRTKDQTSKEKFDMSILEESGEARFTNSDEFFLYLNKNHLLITKLMTVLNNRAEELTDEESRFCFELIAELIVAILTRVQSERREFCKRVGLTGLNSDWWLHGSDFLYGDMGICMLAKIFGQKFGIWGEENIARFNKMLKNLVVYLTLELNSAAEHNSQYNRRTTDDLALKEMEKFVHFSMEILTEKNYLVEALKLAESLNSYEYISQLFIVNQLSFKIEDYFEKWGTEFLEYFVDYSCKRIQRQVNKMDKEYGHNTYQDLNQVSQID